MMEFIENLLNAPSFWTGVGFFIIVFALIFKFKAAVLSSAYKRIDKITAEIAASEDLREKAQHLVVEFEKKRQDATDEQETIIATARGQAKIISKTMLAKTNASIVAIENRCNGAIEKAKNDALFEVKNMAIEKSSKV